jgi:hypothetical protein
MKLLLINLILLFRPIQYEYKNNDYYGRMKIKCKSLFGKKYYADKWDHADLIHYQEYHERN